MPFYELQCVKCEEGYSILSSMAECEQNIKKAKCPKCKSKKKTRLLGAPSFTFTNPVGTDRYNNSHDYRFHHAMDKPGGVRDQRKQAQEKSHMGSEPYRHIDDISSGKHFGPVK